MKELTLPTTIKYLAKKYGLLIGRLKSLDGFDESVKQVYYIIDKNRKNPRHVCLIVEQNDFLSCELSADKKTFWDYYELRRPTKNLKLIIDIIINFIFEDKIDKRRFKYSNGPNNRFFRELRGLKKQEHWANLQWLC